MIHIIYADIIHTLKHSSEKYEGNRLVQIPRYKQEETMDTEYKHSESVVQNRVLVYTNLLRQYEFSGSNRDRKFPIQWSSAYEG